MAWRPRGQPSAAKVFVAGPAPARGFAGRRGAEGRATRSRHPPRASPRGPDRRRRPAVHGPDALGEHDDGEPKPARIVHRFLHAVVGGDADDDQASEPSLPQQRLQARGDVAAAGVTDAERRVAVPAVGPLAEDLGARGDSRSGRNSEPQVSPTQWTGQMPPSISKCGVMSGCQSCVYTIVAPRLGRERPAR